MEDAIWTMCSEDPPTPEEEAVLGRRAQAGDEAAVNELVTRNLRFAKAQAAKYHHALGIEFDDAFQAAAVGLMEAARRFDPDRGRFTNYAGWWIRRTLQDEAATVGAVPTGSGSWEDARRARTLEREGVGVEGIAGALGTSPGRVRALLRLARKRLSLDEPMGQAPKNGTDHQTFLDVLEAPVRDHPDRTVGARELRDTVRAALAELEVDHPREAEVLRMVYAEGWSLTRIGHVLGVSGQRAGALRDRALRRLRDGPHGSALEELVES